MKSSLCTSPPSEAWLNSILAVRNSASRVVRPENLSTANSSVSQALTPTTIPASMILVSIIHRWIMCSQDHLWPPS